MRLAKSPPVHKAYSSLLSEETEQPMDAFETVVSKLDVREFSSNPVDGKAIAKILEAARLTGSSMNSQHWRFILVRDRSNLTTLARDSRTGRWVGDAAFAVLVLVDSGISGHMIDAGRALQDMQVAAWSLGIVSGVYTGFDEAALGRDFGIPASLKVAAIVGFGYPERKIHGRKNRKPLVELAFAERYGQRLDLVD